MNYMSNSGFAHDSKLSSSFHHLFLFLRDASPAGVSFLDTTKIHVQRIVLELLS